ncbi:hypothetical protein R6Q57_020498 [Mikania cordata]
MDAHESENPRPPSNVAENNDGSHGTNRHGRSKSSWGLSTAIHAVHGVGFVAKKAINNRLTKSLWHSRSRSSSASVSSDASDIPDAKQENHSHESADHHTLQSSLKVADQQTPNDIDQFENLKPYDGSHYCTTGSSVIDQSENTKPTDGSHVMPVNHLGNPKPSASSHVRQVNQHRWPRTIGSNALNKSINHLYEASRKPNLKRNPYPKKASKPLTKSSSDATNLPSSTLVDDGRLKIDEVFESQPSSPNKSYVLASRGVSPSHTRVLSPASDSPAFRGASVTSSSKSASDTTASTRGISPTPSRGVSPTPTRGISPNPTRGVSPMPTKEVLPHARDVSPTSVKPSKPSGRRHFFNANILSIFTKIVDNRKEKNLENPKEIGQHLELLYNIQMQWQFANASAEAALDFQRATAEKSLYGMWRTTLELRDSIASKKIDITLLIFQLKLYAVLYRQMAYIDEWASIQKEHESALFAITNDLQARSLSLPIIGGVKADIKGLKMIVFSTIQVLQATISCIVSSISKLDKTHLLASELADLVLHERALLDECEIFLSSAAPLHKCFLLGGGTTSGGPIVVEGRHVEGQCREGAGEDAFCEVVDWTM